MRHRGFWKVGVWGVVLISTPMWRCSREEPTRPTMVAPRVVVAFEGTLRMDQIAEMVLTVDAEDREPITALVELEGNAVLGSVGVPAGRTSFTMECRDSSGELWYRGSTEVFLEADGDAQMVVELHATNTPPVANAGSDQTMEERAEVTLDGSESRDADGDALTYRWTQMDGPSVALSDAASARPTFTPTQAGVYLFALVVNDGREDSVADEVRVTVESVSASSSGSAITMSLPGGATMEMVWIEPGTFVMGTTEEQKQWLISQGMWDDEFEDEIPAHEVTITKGFWLGKYELTQRQWESVMGTRPWAGRTSVEEKSNHPAVCISWEDIQGFIAKLNQAEGSEVYWLPTEAEWEYACRAATTTPWSFGDDVWPVGLYAWYRDNAEVVGEHYAHAVGTKLPNPWGLYDMHGNVWELVQDWYGSYSSTSQTDPTGPAIGSLRVTRGSSFYYDARDVRSANRGNYFGARLLRKGL